MNVPIPLPQLNTLAHHVTATTPAHFPPTDNDVVAATQLREQAGAVMGTQIGINLRDYAAVLHYETAIKIQVHEHNYPRPIEQGAPDAIAAAIAPLQQQMNLMQEQMQTGFTDIRNQLNRVEGGLIRNSRLAAKTANRHISRGELAKLEVVPFPNNTYPYDLQPPLPPLESVNAVLGLNSPQVNRYFENYYPNEPIPHLINDRKSKILVAIGCEIHPSLFEDV